MKRIKQIIDNPCLLCLTAAIATQLLTFKIMIKKEENIFGKLSDKE